MEYVPVKGVHVNTGTSNLPTYSFASYSNTGMYNAGVNNSLGFSVDSETMLVIAPESVTVHQDLLVSSNILPVSSTQDIGSSSKSFKGAWIDSITVTSNADVGGDLAVDGVLTVSSNIMPTTVSGQNIGSVDKPFKEAWIDTLHISTNTLYLGDTPVLGTDNDSIAIKADVDQSILVKTTGLGKSTLTSERGVEITTSGLNSVVDVMASGYGGRVSLGAVSEISFNAPNTTVSSNLNVQGNLVVNGSQLIVNAQTVMVTDNILVLNAGQVGNGVSAGTAGITVDRGDDPDYQLLFDETTDKFKMGPQGTLVNIASEKFASEASNITGGVLLVNRGGTGVDVSTGTGSNVLNVGATLDNVTILGESTSKFANGYLGTPSIAFASDADTGIYRVADNNMGFSVGGYRALSISSNSCYVNTELTMANSLSTGFANRKMVLSGGPAEDHMFYGFGINSDTLRYQSILNHVFYTAINSSSSTECARINSSGISVNGNVIASSNIVGFNTVESDSNVKRNFEPITDALNKIDTIGAYTFEYRDDDSHRRHAGVIAQQVQKVLPEVVSVHPMKDTLTVAYGNLTSLLIAGIQELRVDNSKSTSRQQQQIEDLRNEVEELRALTRS
jgi:hypothetical protein